MLLFRIKTLLDMAEVLKIFAPPFMANESKGRKTSLALNKSIQSIFFITNLNSLLFF